MLVSPTQHSGVGGIAQCQPPTPETITIKGGEEKRDSKEIKSKREEKRKAKKEYKKACNRKNRAEIMMRLNHLQEKQKDLRQTIENEETTKTQNNLIKLKQEGGAKSNTFWKKRKQILREKIQQSDTIDQNGIAITDPEKAKEHIASYYEELYKARDPKPDYQIWAEIIKSENIETKKQAQNDKMTPFTMKELNIVIKSLKPNKATGPDQIPNEIFIKATNTTRKIILEMVNKILREKDIPEKWKEGEVVTIYKGKGKRGMCKNDRGITLASNFEKLYERLINNRINNMINISEAQAGGKKGISTVDHIIKLKEIIETNKEQNKPTYITFLDVTKAYDKAWIEAIMYIMHKRGIEGALWEATEILNKDLNAKIRTKYGNTRTINIRDSIRQGGVLSVTQYAALMDEIHHNITEVNLVKREKNNDPTCLLWVDDVAIITNNLHDQQKLLDITSETANRLCIEFGKEKSKTIQIGKGPQEPLKLGEMQIEYTDEYKYLGEIMNNKGNLDDHIKNIERKTEAAYQTIIYIANDKNFKGIEMETIWKLVETCIIPIITYGAETWKPNKDQMKKINRILDSIIKRILMTPTSTPRENLYIETGLLDPEAWMIIKQTRYLKKQITTNNNTQNNNTQPKIMTKTDRGKQITDRIQLNTDNINHIPKKQWDRECSVQTIKDMTNRIQTIGQKKSKTRFLTNRSEIEIGKRPTYIKTLTRKQVSALFAVRNRMIKVKDNYKNQYADQTCRGCGLLNETQQHILTNCKQIHEQDNTKVGLNEIFQGTTKEIKSTANKVIRIIEKKRKWEE